MSDLGVQGAGSTIKFTNGTATTTLAQVTSIGLPGISVADIDISTMDSTAKWRSFIPGMKDGGDLAVDCVYESSNSSALVAIVGVAGTWTIQVNDAAAPTSGSKFTFAGYLKSMGGAVPFEDKVTQTITVKVAGQPSFTGKS